MRVLIFGSTSPTGLELTSQALLRGHDVTAYARTPSKLTTKHARLRVVEGQLTQAEIIRGAMAGQDAVLSALGTTTKGPTTEISDGAREIVGAMQSQGVRRLVWLTAMGVGDTIRQMGPIFSRIIPIVLKHGFADKVRQEAVIAATPLDWTIVHPPMLTNSPRTGTYRIGKNAEQGDRLLPKISRADVADFMLNEVENPRHLREVAAVCY